MNHNDQPHEPLQTLLAALLDGEPTTEQLAQLNQQLHEDPAARAFYVRTMSLHARLHARHATSPAIDNKPSTVALRSRLGEGTRHTYEFFARPTPLSLAVATMFLASVLGLMALVAPPIYQAMQAKEDPAAPPVIVARITDTYDATWAAGQAGRERGAQLASGDKLELVEGYVEIAYRDGTRLLLEGPARLVIAQTLRDGQQVGLGRLQRGKLTAHVPPAAVGFTIRTPLVEVIDLGTEFGVEATPRATDVVVFRGKVTAQPSTEIEQNPTHAIAGGQAMRFEPSQPQGRTIEAQANQFARLPPSTATAAADRYSAAVLADGPASYWQLDDEGTGLAVSRTGRPHGVYRNEVQQGAPPRPGDAADGRSARFDGANDYVEIAHDDAHNSSEFTIEFWAQADRVPENFAAVVTSRDDHGVPTGYIVYLSPEGRWQLWTGQSADWAKVEGPAATVGEWTHVTATYQRLRTLGGGLVTGTGSLYVNGKLVAQNKDMQYIPQRDATLPLRIGGGASEESTPRYFFPGQIADVAIYRKALSAQQIEHHFSAATSPVTATNP